MATRMLPNVIATESWLLVLILGAAAMHWLAAITAAAAVYAWFLRRRGKRSS